MNINLKNKMNPKMLNTGKESIGSLMEYCWKLEADIVKLDRTAMDDINNGVNGYEEFRELIDHLMSSIMYINQILSSLDDSNLPV